MSQKVDVLIVDTSALLNNSALHEMGHQIITVQEVINEVTNKRQLRRLVFLPYDLQTKDVFQENIQYITEFSKKTGDYPSLSATDIKVMALAYQLEKEKVGTDHLKKEPHMNRVVTFTHRLPDEPKVTTGFYSPCNVDAAENDELCDTEISDLGKLNSLDINKTDEDIINDILVPVKDDTCDQTCKNELKYDDDDDDNSDCSGDDDANDDSGWITPQNIACKKQEVNSEADEKPMKVACITSDFAMQNVLKQIGLNVLSVDGHQIQQLRSFILRCYACFKTTSIMTKVFCPNCGNRTLKKVAVSLKEDGTQVIHISSKKRLSARGKRFSLPAPKGGKHANNPILCEDQRVPDQRPSRLARTKNNPLDPDYTAGFSPFVMRDVTSRSAMLGIRSTDIKSAMRWNPNNKNSKGKNKKKQC